MSREVIASIEGEYRRCKALAEAAFAQLSPEELTADPVHGNSIATIARHLGGNLTSRFTDFLTTDGEKPWRNRESEFESRGPSAAGDVVAKWEDGWSILFGSLSELTDDHLSHTVTIRGVNMTVTEALHRSLSHTAYHVGQIVQRARRLRGDDWAYLSIPPGGSDAYDRDPGCERPPAV